MKQLKLYFFTGLIVLLPVVLTAYLLFAFFSFVDGILGGFLNSFLAKTVGFYVPGVGLVVSLIIVILTGLLTTVILGKRIFVILENVFLKIPFVRLIYPSAKQIINFVFSKDKPKFKKAVLVEYPRRGIWSVGFITNDTVEEIKAKAGRDLFNVFIPGSPGPFTGYVMFVPKEDIIMLDMSIEEALKIIISGGVVNP
ncbi:MAG: DUF502 domain-containing protein [Candidatus Omnitrophota bacterium]